MAYSLRICVCHAVLALAISPVYAQQSSAKTVQQIWDDLFAGNHRFVSDKAASKDLVSQRRALVKGQHPIAAVLSCSDSRVPPEMVFDKGLGELFVVRSAGEDDDPLALGSLEYAVEHLGTTVIFVMGHQSCGAVTAACAGGKSESRNLDAVIAPIVSSCHKVDSTEPEALDTAIRSHVHEVAQDLIAHSEVIKRAVEEGHVTVIEAYYSLDSGEVVKLR